MVQNGIEWVPSAEQIKLVELLINPEDRRTKTEKMEEAGIPRTTFYRMLKDKNFKAYLREQLDTMTDGELPDVWKAHMLKCKRGDMTAIKLYYEIKGIYVERKEITGKDGGPIETKTNLKALSIEELRALAKLDE